MIHGWCQVCRKIKRVRVSRMSSKLNIGICLDCEQRRK